MKSETQITIRTKCETIPWAFGAGFLEVLLEQGDRLCPELMATFSESGFREKIRFEGVESCEPYWAQILPYQGGGSYFESPSDFLWRRRKIVKANGLFNHTIRNRRNQIVPGQVFMTSAWHKAVNWGGLFRGWCSHMTPQIGMVHVLTGAERFELPEVNLLECTDEEAQFVGGWNDFRTGTFGAALKPEIPNIGWAMFYGDEFAHEVDEAAISAAGFPIEKIGEGYLVQVTEDINDVVNDFAMFSKRRAELKSLFRDDLFLIKSEPEIA